MADEPNSFDNMPLMDLCNDANRLCRALIEHMEQNFIPRVRTLNGLVRLDEQQGSDEDVSDSMVRSRAAEVLESEAFTEKLDGEFAQLLRAIERKLQEIAQSREV